MNRARVVLNVHHVCVRAPGSDRRREEDEDGPPQRLTLALIARSGGASVEELVRAKHMRLDWLRIAAIENLEALSQVAELYLQHVRCGTAMLPPRLCPHAHCFRVIRG
jgi:hypothetical protein